MTRKYLYAGAAALVLSMTAVLLTPAFSAADKKPRPQPAAAKSPQATADRHEAQAIAAYVRGDYAQALIFLEQALKTPNLPPQKLERLLCWLSQIQKAMRGAPKSFTPDTQTPVMALFHVAEKKFQSGRYGEARKAFYWFLAQVDQPASSAQERQQREKYKTQAHFRIAQCSLWLSSDAMQRLPVATQKLLK